MSVHTYITKSDIIAGISDSFTELDNVCQHLSQEGFSQTHVSTWSIEQNCSHLLQSSVPVAKSLKAPKQVLLTFGESSTGSGTYEELVQKYLDRLKEGVKASGEYLPVGSEQGETLLAFLENWRKTMKLMIGNLSSWTEEDLDLYQLPHPAIGKLTIREMLFFTIYHTNHHLNTIQKLIKPQ